jgi:hypothetical protein
MTSDSDPARDVGSSPPRAPKHPQLTAQAAARLLGHLSHEQLLARYGGLLPERDRPDDEDEPRT